jgi:hypothetical protein
MDYGGILDKIQESWDTRPRRTGCQLWYLWLQNGKAYLNGGDMSILGQIHPIRLV